MNNFLRSTAALAALAVAACGDAPAPSTSVTSASQAPVTEAGIPTAAPSPSLVGAPLDSLTRTIAVDRVSSQVGEVVDGRLSANGKAGYLLFGPYVPFAAGTYTATIAGRVDELPAGKKIHLDVVSAKGKAVHGRADVSVPGELPPFDVTVPDTVADLEIRVLVPAGSTIALESYRIEKKL
jgi:hypothetical protein